MKKFFRHVSIVLLLSGLGMPGEALGQEVSVPVSPHRQEHSLSCEVAALKMALSVHGIQVPENELIARLPFDPTRKAGGTWGDPQTGFVGNIDGRMLIDGYGVYSKPIAKVGSSYARTEVIEHGSAPQLSRAISQGNAVIIWGYYGNQRAVISWQTPQGTPIKAVYGEHTHLVYGFDGPVTSPSRFHLIDPSHGSFFSWSTAELMHNWSSLNHMGVIVYPPSSWVRVPGETQIWEIDEKSKTRRWITPWQAFIDRGGSAAAVVVITQEKLLHYAVGAPIN